MPMNNLHREKHEQLIGQKFGFLVVLERQERTTKKRGILYLCECECGTRKILEGTRLRAGKVKSCGCKWKNLISKSKTMQKSGLNKLYGRYKSSAKKRKLEFALTKEQFEEITSKNCYYCDAAPAQVCLNKIVETVGDEEYVYNGIDRVNNDKGYFIDNVVACCKYCNYAKFKHTHEEFIQWVRRIYKNLESIPTL